MNANRRKQLSDITEEIEHIKERLEFLQEEEQEAFDNMPDNFQFGEKGDRMQASIDSIMEAADSLQDAIYSIMEAIDSF